MIQEAMAMLESGELFFLQREVVVAAVVSLREVL